MANKPDLWQLIYNEEHDFSGMICASGLDMAMELVERLDALYYHAWGRYPTQEELRFTLEFVIGGHKDE